MTADCRSSRSQRRSGRGLRELIFAMARLITRSTCRRTGTASRHGSSFGRRRSATSASSPWSVEGELWRVRGDKPERWVRQTDFANAEAVGYLADRLNRIGDRRPAARAGGAAGRRRSPSAASQRGDLRLRPQIDIGAEILEPSRPRTSGWLRNDLPRSRRREKDRAYHAPDESKTRLGS